MVFQAKLQYNVESKVVEGLGMLMVYRHSSIYAVNVGTQIKNHGSKNRVNRGYLVVLKGRKIR